MVDIDAGLFLRECRILNKADPDNLKKYLSDEHVSVVEFLSGDTVFSPENHEKQIGILVSGTALAHPLSTGENATLKILTTRDIFGIANLYSDNEDFPSVITAKNTVIAILIDGSAFMRLLENDVCAMRSYLEFLSEKILYLNKKISTLTAGSTEKKLAFFLCENQIDCVFEPTLPMSAIADMLNVGRASLYRAIDHLSQNGLIARNGKKIIIIDKNALLKFN